jgi:hypothetical protein
MLKCSNAESSTPVFTGCDVVMSDGELVVIADATANPGTSLVVGVVVIDWIMSAADVEDNVAVVNSGLEV